jgi:hypothetical protein
MANQPALLDAPCGKPGTVFDYAAWDRDGDVASPYEWAQYVAQLPTPVAKPAQMECVLR